MKKLLHKLWVTVKPPSHLDSAHLRPKLGSGIPHPPWPYPPSRPPAPLRPPLPLGQSSPLHWRWEDWRTFPKSMREQIRASDRARNPPNPSTTQESNPMIRILVSNEKINPEDVKVGNIYVSGDRIVKIVELTRPFRVMYMNNDGTETGKYGVHYLQQLAVLASEWPLIKPVRLRPVGSTNRIVRLESSLPVAHDDVVMHQPYYFRKMLVAPRGMDFHNSKVFICEVLDDDLHTTGKFLNLQASSLRAIMDKVDLGESTVKKHADGSTSDTYVEPWPQGNGACGMYPSLDKAMWRMVKDLARPPDVLMGLAARTGPDVLPTYELPRVGYRIALACRTTEGLWYEMDHEMTVTRRLSWIPNWFAPMPITPPWPPKEDESPADIIKEQREVGKWPTDLNDKTNLGDEFMANGLLRNLPPRARAIAIMSTSEREVRIFFGRDLERVEIEMLWRLLS